MLPTVSDSIARIRAIADALKGQAHPLTIAESLTEGLAAVADALEGLAAVADALEGLAPELPASIAGLTDSDITGHD